MSIVVFFQPRSLSADQYEQIMAELQKHLRFPWDGLQNTICYGSGDQLRVVDIWESEEKYEQFCEILIPAVSHLGIEMDSPKFAAAYASLENGHLQRYAGSSG
jgi:hypothetical protein